MEVKKWLISWVGRTDLAALEGQLGPDVGPIATALLGEQRYDQIYLLTNYEFERSRTFCAWLELKCGYSEAVVDLYAIDLRSPIDYASIYSEVCKSLKEARLPRDDIELTFHLSPGTPAMAAVWIILAHPVRIAQSCSRRHNLRIIN